MRILTKHATLVFLWAIPLVFHEVFERLLDTSFVAPILSKFQESLFTEILFGILLLYVLVQFIYSKWNLKSHLEWEGIIYSIVLTSYIFIYRYNWFGFCHWHFIQLSHLPVVRYVDLVILIPALQILYKAIPPYGTKKLAIDNKYSLQDDSFVKSIKDDKLNRGDFADLVAKCIVNNKSDQEISFAIGINGKWGDGKTSFQQMIGEKVLSYDSRTIVFTFNAWKSSDERKIIQDFFEIYSSEIGKYDLQLGRKIMKYGQRLLNSRSSWWSSVAIDLLTNRSNQEQIFKDINKSLKRIKRKIVVFIDDLDRLSTREIMEVVKLVRNSANFRNTFFVVGYDQEYLDEALKKHNEYGQAGFLEKIFQIQFDLSRVPPSVIIQQLKTVLEEMLPEYVEQIRKIIGYQPTSNEAFHAAFLGGQNKGDFIPGVLKNLRDVKRFSNFFAMNFRLVATEVVFEDYFYISLIRFKYPLLIRKILENEKSV